MDDFEKEPEIEVNEETGEVKLVGEAPQPQEPAQEPETPKTDVPPEPAQEPTPYDKLVAKFQELGLDRQFKGGIDEALDRLPNMNKYITDLEKERNQYRDHILSKQEPPVEAPEPDFYDDPKSAIDARLAQERTAWTTEIENMKIQNFRDGHKDYDELMPTMLEVGREYPGLINLKPSEAVRLIYSLAKAKTIPKVVEQVRAQPDPSKAVSTTDTKKKAPSYTAEDYTKMSVEELEKLFGVEDTLRT